MVLLPESLMAGSVESSTLVLLAQITLPPEYQSTKLLPLPQHELRVFSVGGVSCNQTPGGYLIVRHSENLPPLSAMLSGQSLPHLESPMFASPCPARQWVKPDGYPEEFSI